MSLESILVALALIGAPAGASPKIAASIATHAKTRTEAAFMLAWGRHESEFRERIIANECRKWECDHGRAIGAWQLHRGAAGAGWEALPGDIDAQARAAARMTRWALKRCDGDVRCAFRALGGLRPGQALKGEGERMATYRRVLAVVR